MTYESVKLTRDCEAVLIPMGTSTLLPSGTEVTVTQSLGDSFTVITEWGYMVRVAGKDADALGKEPPSAAAQPVAEDREVSQEELEELVWEELRTCYDPEIPVNIVDLGLVYRCDLLPLSQGGYRVEVDMTLTAPGCGMGYVLKADAEGKISRLPGVRDVNVELVIDPPWTPDRMSEAAKLQLGFF